MIVSLLVAMDERGGIGKRGGLPWRLSTDLKRFRRLTMGHHIVVGRKTFDAIGHPLAGRQMIIVTRDRDYKVTGCLTAHSVAGAIAMARERGEAELFVCGGAEIYAQTLGVAERIYLTRVHADCEADTFFPEFDRGAWLEVESESHPADEKNEHPFTFSTLVKKRDG